MMDMKKIDKEKNTRKEEVQYENLQDKLLQEKLKPCPFCGSKAELYITRDGNWIEDDWSIACCNCMFSGPCWETRFQAIKDWNWRWSSWKEKLASFVHKVFKKDIYNEVHLKTEVGTSWYDFLRLVLRLVLQK
jgi:hypothetical protein